MQDNASFRAIWAIVASIPSGKVASYGQVARLAGLPRRARLVSRALCAAPAELALPWFRVLNARGTIALPAGSDGHRQQRRALEREGVVFRSGRVDLARFGWRAGNESPLLD
jgi:methylated-DNA-protein-cysteine methyltransferase-like protein